MNKPNPKKLAIKQQEIYAQHALAEFSQKHSVSDELFYHMMRHVDKAGMVESKEHALTILQTFYDALEKLDNKLQADRTPKSGDASS